MKKNIIAGFTLFALIMFSSCGSSSSGEKAGKKNAVAQYTCPMHPEVVSGSPGTCPKCHMDLVEKK